MNARRIGYGGKRIAFRLTGWIVGLVALMPLSAAAKELLRLKIMDSEGKPIPGAQAMIHREESNHLDVHWVESAEGAIRFAANEDPKRHDTENAEGKNLVFIRAAGYSPTILSLELPKTETENVTLEKGRRIEVRLKDAAGRKIPEGLIPAIYFDDPDQIILAWASADNPDERTPKLQNRLTMREEHSGSNGRFSVCAVENSADGNYATQLPEDAPPLLCDDLERGISARVRSRSFQHEESHGRQNRDRDACAREIQAEFQPAHEHWVGGIV